MSNLAGAGTAPHFLTIGHVTRDLVPGGWQLGGTALYATGAALRNGLPAVLLTRSDLEVHLAIRRALPGAAFEFGRTSAQTTTFKNVSTEDGRRQFVHATAPALSFRQVPEAVRNCRIVLFAPVAREVPVRMPRQFPRALRGATLQGWLRAWREDGSVYAAGHAEVAKALPHLDVAFVSYEDVLWHPDAPPDVDAPQTRQEADVLFARWAHLVPMLVVTHGRGGATLYTRGEPKQRFPGYAVRETNATGAGDVFAAAFLCHLAEHRQPTAAVDFANRFAACFVEAGSLAAMPERAAVLRRFPDSA